MTAFWHAYADMAAVEGREVTLGRGEGGYVWDDTGRRYLDGSASLWYANVGHGRRELLAEREDPLGIAAAVIDGLTGAEKREVLDAHPAR